MNLDLRVYPARIRQEAPVVADRALVVLLTTVAVLYSLGRRVGSAYFANREEVDAGVREFTTAVVTGTKVAYATTYQLGVAARGFHEEHLPSVHTRLDQAYTTAMDLYNTAVVYLEDRNVF